MEIDLEWPKNTPVDAREIEKRLCVHANAVLLPPFQPMSVKVRSVQPVEGS